MYIRSLACRRAQYVVSVLLAGIWLRQGSVKEREGRGIPGEGPGGAGWQRKWKDNQLFWEKPDFIYSDPECAHVCQAIES